MNEIEKMDKDSYDAYFHGERTWNVILSDGTSVPLKPNGNQLTVLYEERLEYVQLVREARLSEMKHQVGLILIYLYLIYHYVGLILIYVYLVYHYAYGHLTLTVDIVK